MGIRSTKPTPIASHRANVSVEPVNVKHAGAMNSDRGDPKPPDAQLCEGIVQRVLPERGYGFIRGQVGENAGIDFFFHTSGLVGCSMRDLVEGTLVRFEPRRVARGPRAEQIEVVSR